MDAFRRAIRRRRVRRGHCLEHCTRFIDVAHDHPDPEARLCMGEHAVGWHCWIERADTVFDLTRPEGEVEHDRRRYYRLSGINPGGVTRYTADELARLMRRHGELLFYPTLER